MEPLVRMSCVLSRPNLWTVAKVLLYHRQSPARPHAVVVHHAAVMWLKPGLVRCYHHWNIEDALD